MSSVTKRPPIKGYTKKLQKENNNNPSKPETIVMNGKDNISNFMFAPPMRPTSTAQSHDSIILKRLEDMTRRMDLMQNNQSLSSATQLLQAQAQSTPRQQPLQLFQPQPPSYQSQPFNNSPRPFELKPTSLSPQRQQYSQEAFANKVYQHTPRLEQTLDHNVGYPCHSSHYYHRNTLNSTELFINYKKICVNHRRNISVLS